MLSQYVYIILIFAMTLHEPCVDAPAETINPNNIIQRVPISARDHCILVPILIDNKSHLFILDTGADHTLFDMRLKVGQFRGEVFVEAPHGMRKIKTYDAPESKLGDLDIRFNSPIGKVDLKEFREAFDVEIEGILGMDFLGQHILHIDFDRGELFLMKAADSRDMEKIPLDWEFDQRPTITAFVGDNKRTMIIDTGHLGPSSISLEKNDAQALCAKGVLEALSEEERLDFVAKYRTKLYRGRILALGGFAVRNIIITENGSSATLGLGFWSRFAVTFDFPNKTLYLRKGKKFDRADRWNDTGLHFINKRNKIVLSAVDRDSRGARAGLQPSDVILEISGVPLKGLSVMGFNEILCREEEMSCVYRRGELERGVIIRSRSALKAK
jgi:hypothetical protein